MNQSENSFLLNSNNNINKKNDENLKVTKIRRNLKENKSCDTFLPKKNSVFVDKINLKVIKKNKEKENIFLILIVKYWKDLKSINLWISILK